jgi:hypothetical protein
MGGGFGLSASPSNPDTEHERMVRHMNAQFEAVNKGFVAQGKAMDGIAGRVHRVELELHAAATRDAIREQYRQAHGYSQVVIGTGYVGFFALLALLKDDLPPTARAASGLLIGISLAAASSSMGKPDAKEWRRDAPL